MNNKIFIRCPYCGDSIKHPHKAHLEIDISKMLFYCYRCSTGGTVYKLLKDYPEIVNKINITISAAENNTKKKHHKLKYTLIPIAEKHIEYLKFRKVYDFIIDKTNFELYTFKEKDNYIAFKYDYKLQARTIDDTEPRYLSYILDDDITESLYFDTFEIMKDTEIEKNLNVLVIVEGIFDLLRLKYLFPEFRIIATCGFGNFKFYVSHNKNINKIIFGYDKDINILKDISPVRIVKFLIANGLNHCDLYFVEYKPPFKDPGEIFNRSHIIFHKLTLDSNF